MLTGSAGARVRPNRIRKNSSIPCARASPSAGATERRVSRCRGVPNARARLPVLKGVSAPQRRHRPPLTHHKQDQSRGRWQIQHESCQGLWLVFENFATHFFTSLSTVSVIMWLSHKIEKRHLRSWELVFFAVFEKRPRVDMITFDFRELICRYCLHQPSRNRRYFTPMLIEIWTNCFFMFQTFFSRLPIDWSICSSRNSP